MTKDEYTAERLAIIARLGPAVKGNGFETVSNQCQIELDRLLGHFMASKRAEQKQAKTNTAVKPVNVLQETLASIPELQKKEWKKQPLPEIIVSDKDLKGFTAIQAGILREHFLNLDLSSKTLANKFNQSYQFVAGLLRSKEVCYLETKYFREVLSIETQKSILRAVKAGDNRILEASTEYLKLLT